MEHIDEALLKKVDSFIESAFAPSDDVLTAALRDADAAGLPAIHVSSNEGKLLYLLALIANARRVLEIGTLGGYSTIWLGRAVAPGVRVVTLESNSLHAKVSRGNIERAGLRDIIQIREGRAAETLETMIAAREEPFDLIFIDADKPSYVEYLRLALKLSRPGTVILADNLICNGRVFDADADENARGVKAYNEAITSDTRLESLIVPIFREKLDGLGISIVRTTER